MIRMKPPSGAGNTGPQRAALRTPLQPAETRRLAQLAPTLDAARAPPNTRLDDMPRAEPGSTRD